MSGGRWEKQGLRFINKIFTLKKSNLALGQLKKPRLLVLDFLIVFYNVSNSGAIIMEIIAINLIKIFRLGPEVSLNGSPTVSPTTAALWVSEPLPPKLPLSIYFFALSQAPPALAIITANKNPVKVEPANSPAKVLGPRNKPTATGVITASNPGAIIFFRAAAVEIS